MKSGRLTLVFVVAVLFSAAFAATFVLGGFLRFAYRNAPGLTIAQTASQILGGFAILALLVACVVIAGVSALQHAPNLVTKLPDALPAYAIGFTVVGGVFMALGIGTVGPFITIWLVAGAILTAVSVGVASWRTPLGRKSIHVVSASLVASGALAALASLATVAMVVIVLTATPTFGGGGQGGPGGAAGGPRGGAEQGLPGNPGAAQSQPGGQPGQQGGQRGQGQPGQAGGPQGGQPGQRGPGQPGGEGGPGFGGGQGNTGFVVAGVAMAVLAGLLLFVGLGHWRATRSAAGSEAAVVQADFRRESIRSVQASAVFTAIMFVLGQIVPVSHTNPAVTSPVQWDSPQTRDLVARACNDCHSNETTWPWYSYVAPASWLVSSHVVGARAQFNLSELDKLPAFRRAQLGGDMAQRVRQGSMPPPDYLLMHPEARLSAAERQQMVVGLTATFSSTVTGR